MRWIVNHVPTTVLGVLIVGGAIAIALLVWSWVLRRGIGTIDTETAMDPLGIVGMVYGLVLALVIFGLWTNLQAAHDTVSDEASALAQVALDIRALPPGDEKRVETAISRYIDAVVHDEWKLMSVGRESSRAHTALDNVALALEKVGPKGETADVWYTEAVTKLNDVATFRRQRIEAVRSEMPGAVRGLVFGGAIPPVAFVVLISRKRIHGLLVAGVTGLVAYTLFLVVVLDYPFSGTLSVSFAPFHQGVLAHLGL